MTTTKPSDLTEEQLDAAVQVAELALLHRDEIEAHLRHLERTHYSARPAHYVRQLLEAIITYERRKHI